MLCFDTDVVAAALSPDPPLHLVRRLARTPAAEQCTTSVTLAEIAYAVARSGDGDVVARLRDVVTAAQSVAPFDDAAAAVYGPLRARLEQSGTRLDEASLRIASIVLAGDMTLVTGRAALYRGIPGLRVENWLVPEQPEQPDPTVEAEPPGAPPAGEEAPAGRRSDGGVRPGMLSSLGGRVRAVGEAQRAGRSVLGAEDTAPGGPQRDGR